nr:keratin-associated protein 21-1-like [Vulpes vulpes]
MCCNYGNSCGYGCGCGYGYGCGPYSGCGYRTGYGCGYGCGYGSGYGCGCGSGWGCGRGFSSGCGYGSGCWGYRPLCYRRCYSFCCTHNPTAITQYFRTVPWNYTMRRMEPEEKEKKE